VFALETGAPVRVAAVLEVESGDEIDCLLEAEPARLSIIG
jgi:hypothetical protein